VSYPSEKNQDVRELFTFCHHPTRTPRRFFAGVNDVLDTCGWRKVTSAFVFKTDASSVEGVFLATQVVALVWRLLTLSWGIYLFSSKKSAIMLFKRSLFSYIYLCVTPVWSTWFDDKQLLHHDEWKTWKTWKKNMLRANRSLQKTTMAQCSNKIFKSYTHRVM